MSKVIEEKLAQLINDPPWEAQTLTELLQEMLKGPLVRIIIVDGIDECSITDRTTILQCLKSIFTALPKSVKILISSRIATRREIERYLHINYHVDLSHPKSLKDIEIFIDNTIEEKIQSDQLVIGDPGLRQEIRSTLCDGAQGM
jgi:hypothetical protein